MHAVNRVITDKGHSWPSLVRDLLAHPDCAMARPLYCLEESSMRASHQTESELREPRGRQDGLHLEEGSPGRDKANRILYGRLAPSTCTRTYPYTRANCPQPQCAPSHSCSSGIRGCDELRNCPRNHTGLCPCPHVRACWLICAESRCRTVCPRRFRGTPAHRAPSLALVVCVVWFVRHDAHFHALLPGVTPATGRHQYDWEMLGICHDV